MTPNKSFKRSPSPSKKRVVKTHWYKYYHTECPVCGSGEVKRERVYGRRPENWGERHEFIDYYDWCLE